MARTRFSRTIPETARVSTIDGRAPGWRTAAIWLALLSLLLTLTTARPASPTETVQYVYDSLNRLAEERYPEAVVRYTYDAAGNRLTKRVENLLSLSVTPAAAAEGGAGNTPLVFTLTLSAPSTRVVKVDYATVDGTALASSDYVATSGTVSFPAGTTQRTVAVQMMGDLAVETDEVLSLAFTNAVNVVAAIPPAVGKIQNDDQPPPSISIGDVSVAEGNTGSSAAVFTVSLSAASSTTVSVQFATADGTATVADGDYVSGSGPITFPAGSTTQTVSVGVNGDAKVEANETFTISLSGATGATIADAQGVGTITNDDVTSYLLTVALDGTGTGSVSSSPVGISCGADCTESYAEQTVVTLTASADAGSAFVNWGGACSGTSVTCQVTMSVARSVTATFAPVSSGADFYTVAPCRVLDSRQAAGPWGGTPLAAGQQRDLIIGGTCAIPVTAQAVSINITAVDATASGHLRIFPAGSPRPTASVVNFRAGLTRANNAIVPVNSAAAVTLYSGQPTGAVHVIVDVNGWFE